MAQLYRATSQTITRPNDANAYTIGDLIGNDAAVAANITPFLFSNVVFPSSMGFLQVANLVVSQNLLTNGSFRLHLFTAAPTVANPENGALSIATNLAAFVASVDIALTIAGTGGAMGRSALITPGMPFTAAATPNLWGLLEARAAYVPAANETFVCSLDIQAGN